MRTFNIHEAKTHLSRLVDEAEQGEPFIIAKAGKPKVKVVRLDAPIGPAKRRLGSLEGIYTIPEELDEIDRQLDKEVLRRAMIDDSYEELPVLGQHAVAVDTLPTIHKDPFDRILIAQAMVEGITLLTASPVIAQYPGPIRKV